MKFVLTIDVEEDNWGVFDHENIQIENISEIPRLQSLFDEFGIKPVYLINYPVATDSFAIDLLSSYAAEGKCEIGMHCHPWNTPPTPEAISDFNSMLCNLPGDLVHQKLSVLHETICENLRCVPVSFRAGRWGFGPAVAASLVRLGYRIDSSVSPYIDWSRYHGPNFSQYGPAPFCFTAAGIEAQSEQGDLLQVPASIGFLQSNFDFCQRCFNVLSSRPARKLHLIGILNRLGLFQKVWLSPEVESAQNMICLSRQMIKNNFPVLNFTFHSSSLLAGLGPFVQTRKDQDHFMEKIREYLSFICTESIENITLSELAESQVVN